MKSKLSILILLIAALFINCSESVEYSDAFKKETSGKYLYNSDELILVHYEGNQLHVNWKGGDIKPVTLKENEFFVPDMYKKFRFVKHPETQEYYLSIVDENNQEEITYDYLKVNDDYKTPSQYLEAGDYEKALAGYLDIKKQDSTSSYINERDFNSIGYKHLRKKEYEKAINVFQLNTKLHPNSDNVYDSLADAYVQMGDSLQAYNNYKKALDMDPHNRRAERYLKAYESTKDIESE